MDVCVLRVGFVGERTSGPAYYSSVVLDGHGAQYVRSHVVSGVPSAMQHCDIAQCCMVVWSVLQHAVLLQVYRLLRCSSSVVGPRQADSRTSREAATVRFGGPVTPPFRVSSAEGGSGRLARTRTGCCDADRLHLQRTERPVGTRPERSSQLWKGWRGGTAAEWGLSVSLTLCSLKLE